MLGVRGRFERARDARRRGEPPARAVPGAAEQQVRRAAVRDRLMLETWLRREGARDRVELTWSTYEQPTSRPSGRGCTRSSRPSSRTAGSRATPARSSTEVAAGEVRYADGTTRALRPPGRLPALRRRGPLRRPAVRRPRLPPDRAATRLVAGHARHLRARRRGRLPGQAGVPRLPAGRRRRRAHRRRRRRGTPSSADSTR